jgi:serine/threonine-protein kinase
MQLGRYEVIRKLGEGGMARVMLGKSSSGDPVVLKVPLRQNQDFAERVRDEARVGLRLNHPSVVDTLDLFEHDGMPILVVEYVEGASLQQLRKHGGPMPPGMCVRVGRQVAEGLAFIHEATDENDQPLNILHRDVAPGNILVTRDGDAKLIDLGIARGMETQAKRTAIGMVRGTMRYLAPELLAGDAHTPATDLWALGIVLFEACLGRRAIEGDERDVLGGITDGRITSLKAGESIPSPLSDGIFALLAEKSARLQRARAAANVLKRIEEQLPPELGWAKGAVQRVLDRQAERAEVERASWADTQVRPTEEPAPRPVTVESPVDDVTSERTAATVASQVQPDPPQPRAAPDLKPALGAPTRLMEQVDLPDASFPDGVAKPTLDLDQPMSHDDGEAPTIRMEAMHIPSDAVSEEQESLPPGAATEIMPAVDESGVPITEQEPTHSQTNPPQPPLPQPPTAQPPTAQPPAPQPPTAQPPAPQPPAAEAPASQPPLPPAPDPSLPKVQRHSGLDSTMKFPKPGSAQNPLGGSSLDWKSVAAPGVLGSLNKNTDPQGTPTLEPQPAAEPEPPAAPAPVGRGGPRLLAMDLPGTGGTEPAMPAAQPFQDTPAPAAAAQAAGVDPRDRAPSRTAIQNAVEDPVLSQEATVTEAQGPYADDTAASYPEPSNPVAPSTEGTLPGGSVPGLLADPASTSGLASVTPVAPLSGTADTELAQPAVNPPMPLAQPPPAAAPVPQPAPQPEPPAQPAAPLSPQAPPGMDTDDETDRVQRWSKDASDAAVGFDEPLHTGELDWKPDRKPLFIAAGAGALIAVIVVVLFALDVL